MPNGYRYSPPFFVYKFGMVPTMVWMSVMAAACEREAPSIFIHVFKAAGSTVRSKLREHAAACNQSLAILVECEKSHIVEAGLVKCELKDEVNGDAISLGHDVKLREEWPSVERVSKFDIIGGHVAPGIGSLFPDVRYVTVLREPTSSLVSGVAFVHSDYDLARVVDGVKAKLDGRGYRNAVSYLSTSGTVNDAVHFVKHMDLVGVMENWQVTMRMFATFYDSDIDWLDGAHHNQGTFSTSDVFDHLDNATLHDIRAHCADELVIYQAALQAHASTCRALLGAPGQGALLPPWARCDCVAHQDPVSARVSVACA